MPEGRADHEGMAAQRLLRVTGGRELRSAGLRAGQALAIAARDVPVNTKRLWAVRPARSHTWRPSERFHRVYRFLARFLPLAYRRRRLLSTGVRGRVIPELRPNGFLGSSR